MSRGKSDQLYHTNKNLNKETERTTSLVLIIHKNQHVTKDITYKN